MTTWKFQCPSLLHSNVVEVQSEQDNQGYKEMKGHKSHAMIANNFRPKSSDLEEKQKPLLIMRFMLPNFMIM